MRNVCFLILSCCQWLISANGYSQSTKLSLDIRRQTIKEVFQAIENKSEYIFFYSNEIDTDKTVSVQVKNQTIDQIMVQVLKNTNYTYSINDRQIYVKANTVLSSLQGEVKLLVTGIVVDPMGEPIIGANIIVKNQPTIGAASDIDGKFSLEVAANAVLQISYVGYVTQDITVRDEKQLRIVLQEDATLVDEVVIMGYSSQKKAELSSAVVTLSADKINDVTSSDIGNMLQGKVSGVMISNSSGQPGSNANIQIRGTGSITAQADPLFVVDGIPGGSFNPNDVETVTVLKDAGATALYGSAAAGGVIIVTTKQANRKQKTEVNLKASYGTKNALQGNFKMMNGAELYDLHSLIFSPALFLTQRPAELRDRNFDWLDASFRTGNLQNYYVSVAGSSGNINYYASADYYQEDGTLINTNFDRISSRLNLNAKLTSNIDMNIRVNYTESKSREAKSYINLEGAYGSMPWDNPYDADGNIVNITGDFRPDNGELWYFQNKRNYLYNEQFNYSKSKSNDLVADLQLSWNILSWLSFSTSNRFARSSHKSTEYIDSRTVEAPFTDGYIRDRITSYGSWGSTNLLKSTNSFGDHTINGMLGWEAGSGYSELTEAAGTGMPNGMEGLTASSPYAVGGYRYETSSWSAFGQVQYNYLNRYFLTASFRADASSIFGKDNRIGYFPSVSGSWLISNEKFLADNSLITFLKLRGSYGVTGNSNISNFRSMALYRLDYKYQDIVGAVADRLANPDLSWESAHMAGIGVDVSLLNRLHLNIDVYNIDNKDLLLEVPKPTSSGFYDRYENSGTVRNQGIEFQISSDNIKTKDFYWNTTFNIGFNKNRVKSLPTESFPLQYSSTGVYQLAQEGSDIFSWYMPKWLGVDYENGDPIWEKLLYNETGDIIGREGTNVYGDATKQIVGKATPKFTGGFTNTLLYKGIGLHITGNFVYGNDVYNYPRHKYDSDGAYIGYNQMKLKDGWHRWEKPGDIVTHPKPVMNGNKSSNGISSRYLEDGSFLRIRNITLSYNLPQQWLETLRIPTCKLFISTDNPFTFTNFSGTDPEVNLKKTSWSLPGVYTESYPVSRQFLFGVEIKL